MYSCIHNMSQLVSYLQLVSHLIIFLSNSHLIICISLGGRPGAGPSPKIPRGHCWFFFHRLLGGIWRHLSSVFFLLLRMKMNIKKKEGFEIKIRRNYPAKKRWNYKMIIDPIDQLPSSEQRTMEKGIVLELDWDGTKEQQTYSPRDRAIIGHVFSFHWENSRRRTLTTFSFF